MAESHSGPTLRHVKHLQTDFHYGCIGFHSHQQYMISLSSYSHRCFAPFWLYLLWVGWNVMSNHFFICVFQVTKDHPFLPITVYSIPFNIPFVDWLGLFWVLLCIFGFVLFCFVGVFFLFWFNFWFCSFILKMSSMNRLHGVDFSPLFFRVSLLLCLFPSPCFLL